eukprot:8435219-Pyramimonas_sp.AAC.1
MAEAERESQWRNNEDLRREVLVKEELKAAHAHHVILNPKTHKPSPPWYPVGCPFGFPGTLHLQL